MINQKVSTATKVLYGTGDLGISLLGSAIQFFLLFFYTDVAGIPAGIVGSALLVGRLTWDAINDPVFGYLSDRTRSRLGRRRVYLFAGAVPLAFATWMLFSTPANLTGLKAFLVVLSTFLVFDTIYTLVAVPYYALSAELTYDYNERSSLIAVRMIFTVVGYILGAAATTALAGLLMNAMGLTEKAAYSGVGAVFGIIAAAAVLVTAFGVHEPERTGAGPSKIPPLQAVLTAFRNRPFVQLMIASAIVSISFTLLTSLMPYFLTYQLGMEGQISLVMLAMLVTIAIFLQPWKAVSMRLNKGPSYAAGLMIASLALVVGFFLPQGPTPLIYVIAVVAGLGFSAQYIFPWSMLPDVVEVDQAMTGERREGIYFGLWNFLGKLTGALGIAMAGWALDLFGYVPNAVQTGQALLGIRLFFAIIPVAAFIIAAPLLVKFPITRKSHAELVERIKEKAAVE